MRNMMQATPELQDIRLDQTKIRKNPDRQVHPQREQSAARIVASIMSSVGLCEGAEACCNLIVELVESVSEVLVSVAWHLKLHAGDLDNILAHGAVDHVPGNLVVAG